MRSSELLSSMIAVCYAIFLSALIVPAANAGSGETVKPSTNRSGICEGYGPQTPRDISKKSGINRRVFTLAPPYKKMNLCNIHTHTNAEHKGPGFSIFAGDDAQGTHRRPSP